MPVATQGEAPRGVIPPMLTPLKDPDTLDLPGTQRLVEHILSGGVHGLFLLGSTGEGPAVAYETRKQLVQVACEQVNGRVPVLVGVTDSAFQESLNMAEFAKQAGADCVVASTPFYFPMAQPELVRWMTELADASPLPVLLYNIPGMTKVSFTVESIRTLAEHSNIVGIKDSSGDLGFFHQTVRAVQDLPDFPVIAGPEELMAETVLLGGAGGVPGGANLFPRLYVDLYDAACRADIETVRRLQKQVVEIECTLYVHGAYGSGVTQGLKCVAEWKSLCAGALCRPFQPLADDIRSEIIQRVQSWGDLS